MAKVIARIKGGLGNQLFCYAAARRLALANDVELVIDDVTGFSRDWRYQRRYALDKFHITARRATLAERMSPLERYRRKAAKLVAQRLPFERRRYIEQEGIDFDARLLSRRVTGTVYLDGFWQSENYFKDVEPTIREDLRVIPPADALNQDMASRILECNAVAVHLRWFNNPGAEETEYNVALSYYAEGMQLISDRVPDSHFFIFSDEVEAAKRVLDQYADRITYVDHNQGDNSAHADLWLMSQCRHFVIANSTFSWWGAWLAKNPEKIVVSPGIIRYSGICAWGFKGLIPGGWIQLN